MCEALNTECNLCFFAEGTEQEDDKALDDMLKKSAEATCGSNSDLKECDIALFILPVSDWNGGFSLRRSSKLWKSFASAHSVASLVLWIDNQDQIKEMLSRFELTNRVVHATIGGHGHSRGQLIKLRHGDCTQQCTPEGVCQRHCTGLRSQ